MAIVDLFKKSLNKEENTDNNIIYEIEEEEDRIVVALVASAMAGEDNPNSEFHISKITRIN